MSTSSGNCTLAEAKAAKQDEFYTQLADIANELKHYKDHFKGKVVLCNCDDPFESNFFKYFAANFNTLGLKKLIATSYAGSPIVGGQLPLMVMEGLKPYLNPLAPMNGGERGQGVRGKPCTAAKFVDTYLFCQEKIGWCLAVVSVVSSS